MFSLFLTLALAMLRVYTDDAHYAAPMNYFALHADFLYGGPDFHFRFLFACDAFYLYRYTIRPRVRSYGESSTATRSPGRMRIKFLRIFPEM